LTAENWRESLIKGNPVEIYNQRTGAAITCTYTLSEKQTAVILDGGLLNHITNK